MQHPICRGIPVLHQSKMRLADDELEHLVSENSLRIQDIKIWAANEAKLEYPTPCPKSDVPERVKAILVKVEAKLDADWFRFIDHPKKKFFKQYVIDQVSFELIMCFDESVKKLVYRCAAGQKVGAYFAFSYQWHYQILNIDTET